MRSDRHCQACGSAGVTVFHEQFGVPVNSCLLVDDRATAAAFPKGDLVLAACPDCGFIANVAFDAAASTYSAEYEETQGFSPRFQEFAAGLAKRWIDTYDIRGRDILEIGCGKGEFLELLCRLGGNRGIGIDPSFREDRFASEVAQQLAFVAEKWPGRHGALTADVIVCRHTLEHIADVTTFVRNVAEAARARPHSIVLFELPDVVRVLEEEAFWDLYYEHCSYFSAGTLARLFVREGLEVLDLWLDFDDQYILIEARPGSQRLPLPSMADDLERVRAAVASFATGFPAAVESWRKVVDDATAAGGPVVIWGAGSKGVSFLTTVEAGDRITAAVDVNPFKRGKFMAGTGHRIVGPQDLTEDPPGTVLVMNAIYREEISQMLASMGMAPEVVAL